MQRSKLGVLAVLTIVGMLAGPLLPASGDTFGAVAFVDGKAVVQCPPDGLGRSGIGAPGAGINKNKNCNWTFSNLNGHKDTHTCVGIGVADVLKKGNKKAPVEAGLCTITASGTLGPVAQWPGPNLKLEGIPPVKIPANLNQPPIDACDNASLPKNNTGGCWFPSGPGRINNPVCNAIGKPKNNTNGCDITKNQRLLGPWCGLSKGQSGNGSVTVGTKTTSISNIRWQSQGTLILVTATASKPGVSKPGQAGPALIVVHARFDEHKVLQGVPNSSCLTNGKNFKVDGIAVSAMIGTK